MNDQELAERLARLATEMDAVSGAMHARGSAVDDGGNWRQAFTLHRHAEEMAGAAKLTREWAVEISREAEK